MRNGSSVTGARNFNQDTLTLKVKKTRQMKGNCDNINTYITRRMNKGNLNPNAVRALIGRAKK